MLNVSIAGYAGWPAYDTFLIVSLSGRPVYDPNPLRPNPNPKKPVSCSRVGSNIDTPRWHNLHEVEAIEWYQQSQEPGSDAGALDDAIEVIVDSPLPV